MFSLTVVSLSSALSSRPEILTSIPYNTSLEQLFVFFMVFIKAFVHILFKFLAQSKLLLWSPCLVLGLSCTSRCLLQWDRWLPEEAYCLGCSCLCFGLGSRHPELWCLRRFWCTYLVVSMLEWCSGLWLVLPGRRECICRSVSSTEEWKWARWKGQQGRAGVQALHQERESLGSGGRWEEGLW